MKHITKTDEPYDYTEWKTNDKMQHRPNWKRLPSAIKNLLHHFLLAEQGGLCCYCERSTIIDDSHIEHICPQKKNECKSLIFDFNNLLCSCQKELSPGEPWLCGKSKNAWYDKNLFVSPLDSTCEQRFSFAANGSIRPRVPDDIGATVTIEKLNLDCELLKSLRKSVIEGLVDDDFTEEDITDSITAWLERNEDGTFNEFYVTVKYLFREYLP